MVAHQHRSLAFNLLFVSILFAVLAFMPVTDRPGFEIRNTLTPNRIIEISFLIFSSALLTGSAIFLRTTLRFYRTPVCIFIVFSLWALLSTLWSDSSIYTFGKSLEFALLVYISILISSIASGYPEGYKELLYSKLPYVMVFSLLLIVVANAIIHGAFFNIHEATLTRSSRLSFGTLNPLASADFFAITIIIIFASSISWGPKMICIAIGIILLIMTNGRGPIGISLFAVSAMMYKSFSTLRGRLVFLFAMLFLIMLSAVLFIFLGEEAYSLMPQDIWTLNNRVSNWLFSLTVAVENLVIGVGYFASRESLIDFSTFEGTELHAWGGQVHNSYIEILLTTGIVGFGILLWFVIYGFRNALRSDSLLLVGLFIYVIARSILDSMLFKPGIPMFLLMLVVTTLPTHREQVHQSSMAAG